jgi:acyl carrier protein
MRLIDEEMPPRRGVIHSAMIIDDAIATGLTRERIRNVLAPKMAGAWNLHLATKDRPLDFFVVYSSAAAVIGNEGQSAYGAANLFLDGLAHYRRARGLPATSVAWGAIGDVGYLADRAVVRKALAERFGVNAMPAAKALERLDRAIQDGDPYIILAEMNWSRLFRTDHIAALRRFTDLKAEVELGGPEDAEAGLEDLRALIANLPRAEAVAIVQQSLVRQIAQVLRIPPGKLDAERSLLELGMDSLMVVEMQMAVEKNLGVGLSTAELIDKPTIAALSARLTDRLLGADAPAAGAPPAGAPAAPANGAAPAKAGAERKENGVESLDAMSDENVYELVARLADATPEPPKQPVKTA